MRRKWTLILLGSAALLLVPWMVVLALTLPTSTEVRNWSLAWIGLDVLMALGCAPERGSRHRRQRPWRYSTPGST
jgi:hypothetical protein